MCLISRTGMLVLSVMALSTPAGTPLAPTDTARAWATTGTGSSTEVAPPTLAALATLIYAVVRTAARETKDERGSERWLVGGLLGAVAANLTANLFAFDFSPLGDEVVYQLNTDGASKAPLARCRSRCRPVGGRRLRPHGRARARWDRSPPGSGR